MAGAPFTRKEPRQTVFAVRLHALEEARVVRVYEQMMRLAARAQALGEASQTPEERQWWRGREAAFLDCMMMLDESAFAEDDGEDAGGDVVSA